MDFLPLHIIYTAIAVEKETIKTKTWKVARDDNAPQEMYQWLGETSSKPQVEPTRLSVRDANENDIKWIAKKLANQSGIEQSHWTVYRIQKNMSLFVLQDICDTEWGTRVLLVSEQGEISDRLDEKIYYHQVKLTALPDHSVLIGVEKKGGIGGDIFAVTEDGKFKRLYRNKLFYGWEEPPESRCAA